MVPWSSNVDIQKLVTPSIIDMLSAEQQHEQRALEDRVGTKQMHIKSGCQLDLVTKDSVNS